MKTTPENTIETPNKIRPLKLGSCFSGLGGFEKAGETAGFDVAWQIEWAAAAQHVLKRHWPEVPLYGDITTVDTHILSPVDVVAGGSPCFVAGTLILTQRGLIPIERVVVGDEVLTHQLRWHPVADTMHHRAYTVEIQGMGHNALRTTANHPFYARASTFKWRSHPRGYDHVFGEPTWVYISNQ